MAADHMDANGWFDPAVVGGTAIDQMQAGVTVLDSSHTTQLKISQANHEKMMASMSGASAGSYSALTTSLPNPFVFLKKKITWLLISIAALVGLQLKLHLPPQPLEIVVAICLTSALVFMVSSLASKFSVLKATGLMLLLLVIAGLAIFVPLIYYPQSKTALKIESVLIVFFGEYIPQK